MNGVTLTDVGFRYGETVAADHVSIQVERGEFFALLGPSGSGKTTLLRMIAGFIRPQQGTIAIDGEPVQDTPVYNRKIGFVFQNYALFPHMSVAQNVAFGLESQRVPRAERRQRVKDALALVQLNGFENRRPAQLSGGQQQRVALARALVTEPRVLLLDEPLAALDRKLRVEMQVELRELQQRLGITTVFVTHDQEEAMTLADRIAVLCEGRVEQTGTPREVYERPLTRFTAEFLGMSNIFTGAVVQTTTDRLTLQTAAGNRITAQRNGVSPADDAVSVVVRPERMTLHTDAATAPEQNALQATITHQSYAGASVTYHLALPTGDSLVVFEQSGLRAQPLEAGQPVTVGWSPADTVLLAE